MNQQYCRIADFDPALESRSGLITPKGHPRISAGRRAPCARATEGEISIQKCFDEKARPEWLLRYVWNLRALTKGISHPSTLHLDHKQGF